MKSKLLVIALIVLVNQASSLPSNHRHSKGRIVGGYPISITVAPYQVSLRDYEHFCGGSIISKRWILSAAHCVDDLEPFNMQVRVGSSFHKKEGKLVNVAKIIPHPKYNEKLDYDYALIELKEELEFSESIQPIALPSQDEKVEIGSQCLVSGWGLTQNPQESRDQLRAVVVPIVNHEECRQKYEGFLDVTSRMICAGFAKGQKDACQDDSGGPLVHNKVLYGVVSWGRGCGEPDSYGVYANVAHVRDWIKNESGV